MCLLTTFAGVQLVAPQEGAGVLLRVSAAVGTAIVVIHAPTNSMRTSEYTVTAAYAQKPCITGSHKLQVPQPLLKHMNRCHLRHNPNPQSSFLGTFFVFFFGCGGNKSVT